MKVFNQFSVVLLSVASLASAEDKWVWSDKLQDRSDDAPRKHNSPTSGTKTDKRKPLQDELDDLENVRQGPNM